jgi:hypothetical protein
MMKYILIGTKDNVAISVNCSDKIIEFENW